MSPTPQAPLKRARSSGLPKPCAPLYPPPLECWLAVESAVHKHESEADSALQRKRVLRKRRRALASVDVPLHAFAAIEGTIAREKLKLRRCINKQKGAPNSRAKQPKPPPPAPLPPPVSSPEPSSADAAKPGESASQSSKTPAAKKTSADQADTSNTVTPQPEKSPEPHAAANRELRKRPQSKTLKLLEHAAGELDSVEAFFRQHSRQFLARLKSISSQADCALSRPVSFVNVQRDIARVRREEEEEAARADSDFDKKESVGTFIRRSVDASAYPALSRTFVLRPGYRMQGTPPDAGIKGEAQLGDGDPNASPASSGEIDRPNSGTQAASTEPSRTPGSRQPGLRDAEDTDTETLDDFDLDLDFTSDAPAASPAAGAAAAASPSLRAGQGVAGVVKAAGKPPSVAAVAASASSKRTAELRKAAAGSDSPMAAMSLNLSSAIDGPRPNENADKEAAQLIMSAQPSSTTVKARRESKTASGRGGRVAKPRGPRKPRGGGRGRGADRAAATAAGREGSPSAPFDSTSDAMRLPSLAATPDGWTGASHGVRKVYGTMGLREALFAFDVDKNIVVHATVNALRSALRESAAGKEPAASEEPTASEEPAASGEPAATAAEAHSSDPDEVKLATDEQLVFSQEGEKDPQV